MGRYPQNVLVCNASLKHSEIGRSGRNASENLVKRMVENFVEWVTSPVLAPSSCCRRIGVVKEHDEVSATRFSRPSLSDLPRIPGRVRRYPGLMKMVKGKRYPLHNFFISLKNTIICTNCQFPAPGIKKGGASSPRKPLQNHNRALSLQSPQPVIQGHEEVFFISFSMASFAGLT